MDKKLIILVSFILAFGFITPNTVQAQDPNLVGLWTFDEMSGTTVYDTSGNGYYGTLEGNPQWVTGYKGGAIQLDPNDGEDDYVELNIGSLIPTLSECTFSIWVNWAGRPVPTQGAWQRILDFGSSQANYIYLCPSTGSANMAMRLALVNQSTGIWDEFDASTGILPTDWHHIAITVSESTTTMILYLDGEMVGSKTNCRNSINNLGETTNNWLGRSEYADPYLNATLDEFRIYNRVFAQNEIGKAANPEKASVPRPENGSIINQTDVTLEWDAGIYAAATDGHHVYFGNNYDEVNEGTGDTDKGLTSDTSYALTGLIQGQTYYWRIDEVNGADVWKGDVWSFTIQPYIAYNPSPSDGAIYIRPDVELAWSPGAEATRSDIYLGTSFEDVNNATRSNSMGTLAKSFYSGNTYNPGPLEYETTYYWRIDGVKGATIWKGDVWSFTTIFEIEVTDPNLVGWWKLDDGEGTVALDWSGNYNHGTLVNGPTWGTGQIDGDLEFDGINDYVDLPIGELISTLDECTLTIWVNFFNPTGGVLRPILNIGTDTTNYAYLSPRSGTNGAMHVGIVTADGATIDLDATTGTLASGWHHVAMTSARNSLQIFLDGQLAGNTASESVLSDLGVTVENWLGRPEWPNDAYFNGALDDFRIYNRVLTPEEITTAGRGYPLLAWNPQPANGADADIVSAAVLSWSPGDNAVQHDVYFGTDAEAVDNADSSTANIYRGRQSAMTYTLPEQLEWNQTYFWRIDEYNNDGTISKGKIWSFAINNYLVVDDFESYNDLNPNEEGSKRIYSIWIDGYDNPTVNGSTIGYPDPSIADGEHFVETTTVHSGSQSTPLFYDNQTASYSEATVNTNDLTIGQDWTKGGVQVLSLWFYGDPNNSTTEQLYVKLNGVKVTYDGDTANLATAEWTQWNIELSTFGINPANVTSLTIGLERTGLTGGSGMLFIDDIRLYPSLEAAIEP